MDELCKGCNVRVDRGDVSRRRARFRRRATVTVAVAVTVAAVGALEPAGGAMEPSARLQRELAREIDKARAERGLRPLRRVDDLGRWAEARATRAAARGGVEASGLRIEEAAEGLRRLGYEVAAVAEVLLQADGEPSEVVDLWRRRRGGGFEDALSPAYRDLGIGVAIPDRGAPIYAFVLALSDADRFAERVADLGDLEAVRAELLARSNAARRDARRPALHAQSELDRAAQAYAELMLARGHRGHTGPDGSTPLDRARAAGYDPRAVAENLAHGQDSPAEVVAAWLASEHHRENLLSPTYRDVGHGLAYGRGPEGRQIVWVQLFGSPAVTSRKSEAPSAP